MSSNFTMKKCCEYCQNVFIAKKSVTRFCSQSCNNKYLKRRARVNKQLPEQKVDRKKGNYTAEELMTLEFLTVKRVAKLLGASKKIIYTMIRSGRLRATNLSVRKTIISRNDIDALFDLPAGRSGKALNPNYCRMAEAALLFKISESALFEIIRRNQISKFKEGKFTYVAKSDLEKVLT